MTKTAQLKLIADDIESDWPEHATFLRTINLGRKRKRIGEFSEHDYWLADIFCQMENSIAAGEDEGAVIAKMAESPEIAAALPRAKSKFDYLCRLRALESFSRVRKIVKQRRTVPESSETGRAV